MYDLSIFWFRRDLRYQDNKGLYEALVQSRQVLPLFIFDQAILDNLQEVQDRRVNFIYEQIQALNRFFGSYNSGVLVKYGYPQEVFRQIFQEYPVRAVFVNQDYEPYATDRDERIRQLAVSSGADFLSFKDQVIFEKDEVVKANGKPYTVFTPYMKKWKVNFTQAHAETMPSEQQLGNLYQMPPPALPELSEIGFRRATFRFPSSEPDPEIIRHYSEWRDYPAEQGTTRIGVHLRFGTVSVRHLINMAVTYSPAWWNELIWREFYMMILWHFPHVVTHSFKSRYDLISWRNNEQEFEAWKNGRTGYPFVDAGMRELNQTGYMHNRVRMVTASFLTKHLLIDWRWGEGYFARKLMDYELASNNGGWQWAAGSGCDAAPYFRIFNPTRQLQRFDPQLQYVRQWVPEFEQPGYVPPLVKHKAARERALQVYKDALN